MNRHWTRTLLIVSMSCGVIPAVFAAEHAGESMKEHGGKTLEQPSAPAASSTPAPAPQALSVRGSIAALDLTAQSPNLKLTAADGKVWTLSVNPQAVTVWKGGQVSSLETVKAGDNAKVRYTEKDGTKWVKSIELVQAPQPVALAAPAAASTEPKAKSY